MHYARQSRVWDPKNAFAQTKTMSPELALIISKKQEFDGDLKSFISYLTLRHSKTKNPIFKIQKLLVKSQQSSPRSLKKYLTKAYKLTRLGGVDEEFRFYVEAVYKFQKRDYQESLDSITKAISMTTNKLFLKDLIKFKNQVDFVISPESRLSTLSLGQDLSLDEQVMELVREEEEATEKTSFTLKRVFVSIRRNVEMMESVKEGFEGVLLARACVRSEKV